MCAESMYHDEKQKQGIFANKLIKIMYHYVCPLVVKIVRCDVERHVCLCKMQLVLPADSV